MTIALTFSQTLKLIDADLRERNRRENRPFNWLSYVKVLLNPPGLAVIVYRLQYWFYSIGFTWLAEALRFANLVLFNTDIGSKATIGEGFCIVHANGIYVANGCHIGTHFHLIHHNSLALGPRPGMKATDLIIIGNHVVVGCGARILGNVVIGDNTFIATGEVVTTDVPPYSFFFQGRAIS